MRREFQFVGDGSSKFWTIDLAGAAFTVQFGRIGTAGQTQTKAFASDAEAAKVSAQLIAEKMRKGYVETGDASGLPVSSLPSAPRRPATRTNSATAPAEEPHLASLPDTCAGDHPGLENARVTTKKTTARDSPSDTLAPSGPADAEGDTARAPGSAVPTVTRTIALDDSDWHWATWRPRAVRARPPVVEFNLEDCVRRLGRLSVGRNAWQWDWSKVALAPSMARGEACFWLTAMARAGNKESPATLAQDLARVPPPTDLSFDEVCRLFAKTRMSATREVVLVLARLLTVEQLLALLLDTELVHRKDGGPTGHRSFRNVVNEGIHEYVLPYLDDAEVRQIAARVEPLLGLETWPPDCHGHASPVFHLAAMVGVGGPLLQLVRAWKPEEFLQPGWDCTLAHQPQLVVLGLGDARAVEGEMRRLKLPLNQTIYMRGWLATTGYAGLDYARDCILAITNREECEALAQVFARVQAPEAAPHMLELKLSSRAPRVAREWLQDNLACAVTGLIATAGGHGRLADAALDFLRDVKRQGHEALIRESLGESACERIRREVLERTERIYMPFDDATTPDWLTGAMPTAGRKSLRSPAWLPPDALPPLAVAEACLNPRQVATVLSELQQDSLEAPTALLKALRAHADEDSLDAFGWRLFELWLGEGAPAKDKWAMSAMGFLGGDRSALRITPMIRNWPGESQHQRAVAGLDCLRAIGTDTALMCLNGIAQKLPFKALKARAGECMEAIASQRGMTRAELEDRIVPDCDLDERGSRLFDFGPRQFRFVLGAEMKPMVKDGEGRVKPDLPAPNSKDDAEKAAAAGAEWRLLKKQVREVARVQAERLEQAMVTGRHWTVDEFHSLLVRHPLMINLVRLVVWGGYDPDGKLVTTFRVTEEQDLADVHDEPLDLDARTHVGIVHPLHIPDEQKRAWGEVFADYELVAPFPQLGRPIFGLEPGEAVLTELERFSGRDIPATALVGTLERLAWVRGVPEDAGIFSEHTKPFPGADVTAVVTYEGIPVGYMDGWEDQAITGCFFVPGLYTPTMYPDHRNAIRLGTVDPVAISEVLADLTFLASRVK